MRGTMVRQCAYFIGDRFYTESHTLMPQLKDCDTHKGIGWGDIQRSIVVEGNEVCIRPATQEELRDAEKELQELKNRRNF